MKLNVIFIYTHYITGGGTSEDVVVSTENYSKSSNLLILDKYGKGFEDGNEFMAKIFLDKNNTLTFGGELGDKITLSSQYQNDMPSNGGDSFKMMKTQSIDIDLTDIFDLLEKTGETTLTPMEHTLEEQDHGQNGADGTTSNSSNSIIVVSNDQDIDIDDPFSEKKSLDEEATIGEEKTGGTNFYKSLIQEHKMDITNDGENANLSSNSGVPQSGGVVGSSVNRRSISDDIDCVVESCTILKRTNAFTSERDDQKEGITRNPLELVEITEIMPTNSECNQILVKLTKIRPPKGEANTNKLIMANLEDSHHCSGNEYYMDHEEQEENEEDVKLSSVGGQLLMFDFNDDSIPNEHRLAMTFSRAKSIQQMCVLPNFSANGVQCADYSSLNTNNIGNNGLQSSIDISGALCTVCKDGFIRIYSMHDFQYICGISEPDQHFVSVAYCRSVERLCCSTRTGVLFFYSLNDNENESGDEMLELEDDQQMKLTMADNVKKNAKNIDDLETSVTDGGGGISGGVVSDLGQSMSQISKDSLGQQEKTCDQTMEDSNTTNRKNQRKIASRNEKIRKNDVPVGKMSDCENQTSASSAGSSAAFLSSTTSSTISNQTNLPNLLAYRTDEFTLQELETLHSLTEFDENLTMYGAEVPSSWTDLVQAQKQRKQTQNMRNGDDTQFYKTWRLRNDTYVLTIFLYE